MGLNFEGTSTASNYGTTSENEIILGFTTSQISLVPRPKKEEEENGPGFSRSRMRLTAVEFHRLRVLLIYIRTLVTSISILNVALSLDL